VEREEPGHVYKIQQPIYYLAKSPPTTRPATIRYRSYSMSYFESHPIRMVTSFWLGEIIGNRLATGRITKWALELIGLDIAYVPQMAIKSQALMDFVAE
jgi:hypothetical protein